MNRPSASPQSHNNEISAGRDWREHLLQILLQGSSLLGLLALTFFLLTPSPLGSKLFAIFAYVALVFVTIFTKLPHVVRTGVFLLLLYLAGLGLLNVYGITEASMLFLGLIVLTGLLLSSRSAIYYAIGFSLLSLTVFGLPSFSFLEWASSIGIFLFISLLVAIGLHVSLQEFTKTQEDAQHAIETFQTAQSILEQEVQERTASLTRKNDQLRATSYIARKTAEVQDLASLLDLVAKLVTDQFGFYHTGIFLINETGDQAVLQAVSSEGGQQMMEKGHALGVGTQGIVGYVAAQKKPRIAVDVGVDAMFFNNPYLPMTRSEVALPLMVRNKVLGVLDIQSDKQQAFGVDDVDVLQTLADQIAIAIENARLMDETQAAIIQLEALTNLRTREAWNQKLHDKSRVFTYTPLGLRAEKPSYDADRAVSIPIMLRGQRIGSISIARKGDAGWSRLDRDLIEEVASQVGLAVDNIRLLEEATYRAKQEQMVGKLAARFSQSLDLDTLIQTAARELGQLPDISEVSVFIGQETEHTLQSKERSTRNAS